MFVYILFLPDFDFQLKLSSRSIVLFKELILKSEQRMSNIRIRESDPGIHYIITGIQKHWFHSFKKHWATSLTLTRWAISAILLHLKQQLNGWRDSQDTRADPHRVRDQVRSLNGPSMVPYKVLNILEVLSGCFYLLYIIHCLLGPLNILEPFMAIVELCQGSIHPPRLHGPLKEPSNGEGCCKLLIIRL